MLKDGKEIDFIERASHPGRHIDVIKILICRGANRPDCLVYPLSANTTIDDVSSSIDPVPPS